MMFETIIETFEQIEGSVADEDLFVLLIRVAREDADIGKQLVALLSLEKNRRKSELNHLIAKMLSGRAPGNFIRAIACFLDDQVAEKALVMIEE